MPGLCKCQKRSDSDYDVVPHLTENVMAAPSPLLNRIENSQKNGTLSPREAAVLIDMLNAGRGEVEKIIGFIEQYLPAPVTLPRKRVAGLIADETRIAGVRKRIKSDRISATLWAQLQEQNRKVMDPKHELFIDWKAHKNPKLWDRRMGHWPMTRAMQDLAWEGAISRDRKLTEFAAGILVTIAKHRQGWGPMHCNYGRPYMGWLNDNLLDVGHITLGSAITYDLVRPVLSKADRAEIAAYFEPYFHKALTNRFGSLNSPGHNFAPIGFGGTGLLALSLYDEYPVERRGVLEDLLVWAEAYAVFSLDYIAGKDGAAVEGSGYCSASLAYAILFAQGLKRVLGRDLFKHPTLNRFARYLAIETLPGGAAFNNFNDNHYQTNVSLWPMIARQSGDPIGDWVWLNHDGPDLKRTAPKEFAAYSEKPYVLLFRDPAKDSVTPEALRLPRVHHFTELDHLTMRTGWGERDLHITFQCTKPRPNIHTQADRLNFTAYALGERFVIDSGYGMVPIPGSTEVKRMGGHAESHNQVLIDGVGQTHRANIAAGSIERWEREGEWVWVVGEATGSYPAAKTAKRFLAVRLTADEPVLVQVDWIVPADGKRHRYDCLLQSDPSNKVTLGKAGTASIKGGRVGGVMNLVYATDATAKLSVEEWLGHPRLRFASSGVENLATLVMSPGAVKRAGVGVAWTDSRGGGAVSVERVGKGAVVKVGGVSARL